MVNQGGVAHLVFAVVKGGKGVNGVEETQERRGGAVKVPPGADLEYGISALIDTHHFNSGDNETSGGSPTLI